MTRSAHRRDGPEELSPVAEGYAELRQIRVAEVNQDIGIDGLLVKDVGILFQAKAGEPGMDIAGRL
jgi:hypothetical protein